MRKSKLSKCVIGKDYSSLPARGAQAGGFTLIELIIVIGIIVALATIVMLNYGGQSDSLRLKLSMQETVNDLRRVQNFSISTKMAGSNVPRGGYGVRFDKTANSYVIFSDNDDPNPDRALSAGEQVETKALYSRLEISDINVSGSGSVNVLDIVFVPPEPETYINGTNNAGVSAVITLRIKGKVCPESCRTITVKTSGLIE